MSIQKVILRVVHNGVGDSEDSSDYPSSAGNEVVVVVTVMTATVARRARLRIPAGFLQDSFIFLLERFQLKERRSFCEGTLKKSRTDREGTAGTSFLF